MRRSSFSAWNRFNCCSLHPVKIASTSVNRNAMLKFHKRRSTRMRDCKRRRKSNGFAALQFADSHEICSLHQPRDILLLRSLLDCTISHTHQSIIEMKKIVSFDLIKWRVFAGDLSWLEIRIEFFFVEFGIQAKTSSVCIDDNATNVVISMPRSIDTPSTLRDMSEIFKRNFSLLEI